MARWVALFSATIALLIIPATIYAVPPTIAEVLETYKANCQRLEPLHVQLRHTKEYTDAYRTANRKEAEKDEKMLRALQAMKPKELEEALSPLPPGYTTNSLIAVMKREQRSSKSSAKIPDKFEDFVELFRKGDAYQIRVPQNFDGFRMSEWAFPSEPFSAGLLNSAYKDMRIFSWSPAMSPPGRTLVGGKHNSVFVTSRHYNAQRANHPVPPLVGIDAPQDCTDFHPIDSFFRQPPEKYRIVGPEMVEGRELLVVEVPVATEYSGGYMRPNGESYQMKTIYYTRGWLDLKRGALPIKLQIWSGNEEVTFEDVQKALPKRVVTTMEFREVTPGAWYPAKTLEEEFSRDPELLPSLPQSQDETEWAKYYAAVNRVPMVVHERRRWECYKVEAQVLLSPDFFVLPIPEGYRVIDRDKSEAQEMGEDVFSSLKEIGLWWVGAKPIESPQQTR
ncbi:MAG: hypothetical protein U0929_03810 [Planctomycetaceae bacterium]